MRRLALSARIGRRARPRSACAESSASCARCGEVSRCGRLWTLKAGVTSRLRISISRERTAETHSRTPGAGKCLSPNRWRHVYTHTHIRARWILIIPIDPMHLRCSNFIELRIELSVSCTGCALWERDLTHLSDIMCHVGIYVYIWSCELMMMMMKLLHGAFVADCVFVQVLMCVIICTDLSWSQQLLCMLYMMMSSLDWAKLLKYSLLIRCCISNSVAKWL